MVVAVKPTARESYADLKRQILAAGLLRPRPRYYAALIAGNTMALAAVFWLLALSRGGWWVVPIAVGFGFVSGQLGFQMHDAGHRQMFPRRRLNSIIAFATANLCLGMSRAWWVDKHNRHHGNPNNIDLDPDIHIGAITYSEQQAMAKHGAGRWLAARQAYFFFPMLLGLAWAMHVSGVKYLLRERSRRAIVEAGGLIVHTGAYLALLTALVGPGWAVAVILIHKCVGGFYLACVFAPNHKGMPQFDGDDRPDFLRSQVLTSRNVRSHRVTDFLYGGLNYQIEHHLFPTMPRCNLAAAHRIVRSFCAEEQVDYHETSIVQSYREILGFLHEVGAPLRLTAAKP